MSALAFWNDDRLVSSSRGGTVKLWDVATGALLESWLVGTAE